MQNHQKLNTSPRIKAFFFFFFASSLSLSRSLSITHTLTHTHTHTRIWELKKLTSDLGLDPPLMPVTQPQTAPVKTYLLNLGYNGDTSAALRAGSGNIWRTCCFIWLKKVAFPKCSDGRPPVAASLTSYWLKYKTSIYMAPWFAHWTQLLFSPLDVAAPQLTWSAFLPRVRNTFTPSKLEGFVTGI